jgi:glutathione synthase/RimK-type ligase-like ATP-grasp enzyme
VAKKLITLITDNEHKELTVSDQLYAEALRKAGCDVEAVVWDDPSWAHDDGPEKSDAVIFRSAWDTWRSVARHQEFLSFIETVDARTSHLFNAADTLRWGLLKTGMTDLERVDIDLPFTITVPTPADAESVLSEKGWTRAVLKPAIGASGYGVTLIEQGKPIEADLPPTPGPWLVQEFLPEIKNGEMNVVLFNGQVSHMIRKVPAEGEWRSNWAFKPTWTAVPLAPAAAETAQRALSLFETLPLYARVDGVMVGGSFKVLELELVDPSLFFVFEPESASRFANATLDRIA